MTLDYYLHDEHRLRNTTSRKYFSTPKTVVLVPIWGVQNPFEGAKPPPKSNPVPKNTHALTHACTCPCTHANKGSQYGSTQCSSTQCSSTTCIGTQCSSTQCSSTQCLYSNLRRDEGLLCVIFSVQNPSIKSILLDHSIIYG